jgi:hypothetical protein
VEVIRVDRRIRTGAMGDTAGVPLLVKSVRYHPGWTGGKRSGRACSPFQDLFCIWWLVIVSCSRLFSILHSPPSPAGARNEPITPILLHLASMGDD